jgi:hypothetical protein
MTKDDKEHARILFACFALTGAIMSKDSWTPKAIWGIADDMLDAMDDKEVDGGIVSIAPKRKRRIK